MGAGKDVRIDRARAAILLNRQNVVHQATEQDDHRQRKVLIGEKEHLRSLDGPVIALLILADGLLDLFGMGRSVLPRGLEVLGRQSCHCVEDFLMRHPEPAVGHEAPDGDASIADAGFATATDPVFSRPNWPL